MEPTPDSTHPSQDAPDASAPGVRADGGAHRYFFVCGFQRSGTNWVGNLLNLHGRVYCHGEFHLNQAYYGLRQMIALEWTLCHKEPYRTVAIESFHGFVRQCLEGLAGCKAGAAWLGDRTPRELYPLLPGCPHFHAVRDGRDVVVSWTLHQLARGVPEGDQWRDCLSWHLERFREDAHYFDDHPADLLSSESWVRYAASSWAWRVRDDQAIIEKIERGELDARVLPLRYEKIRADPEGERTRMYRFLDLDPAEAEPLSRETRTIAGYTDNNPGGFFRRGEVGDWRRFDRPDARQWFMEEAGRELVALGYSPD